MLLSLSSLQPGEQALVKQLPGDQLLANRLREMGLLSETEITFIRKAPLGDPLEFRLRGYSLSLRKKEAEQVFVKKIKNNE